jgi:hypothetical protein
MTAVSPGRPDAAIENLMNNQVQCDMDGCMVQVSRQALDEVLAYLDPDSANERRTQADARLASNVREAAIRECALREAKPSDEARETIERESPAPDPCGGLSIGELIEWLDSPQYTNGYLDFEAANHMSAAAELLDRLIPERPLLISTTGEKKP